MSYPLIFGTACVGLIVITVVWLALLIKPNRNTAPILLGPAGTLTAAAPNLGVLKHEAFVPILHLPQLTCSLWMTSFVMIALAVAFAFVRDTTRRDRVAAAVCGGLGFLLNATGFLAFMWYATTSAGGV